MNAFEPSTTHSPSSKRPVVRTSAASEPAPGSVSANPPSASPRASGASQRSFCSSVPNRFSRLPASPSAADSVIATDWSTRPSSSSARQTVTASASEPPYASGNGSPNSPRSPICFTTSSGSFSSRSASADRGATTSFGELADDAAERLLLGGQVEVHACRKPSTSRIEPVRSAATTASTRIADLPRAVAEQAMHQHGVGAVELHEADRRPARRAVRRRCRRGRP